MPLLNLDRVLYPIVFKEMLRLGLPTLAWEVPLGRGEFEKSSLGMGTTLGL